MAASAQRRAAPGITVIAVPAAALPMSPRRVIPFPCIALPPLPCRGRSGQDRTVEAGAPVPRRTMTRKRPSSDSSVDSTPKPCPSATLHGTLVPVEHEEAHPLRAVPVDRELEDRGHEQRAEPAAHQLGREAVAHVEHAGLLPGSRHPRAAPRSSSSRSARRRRSPPRSRCRTRTGRRSRRSSSGPGSARPRIACLSAPVRARTSIRARREAGSPGPQSVSIWRSGMSQYARSSSSFRSGETCSKPWPR